MTEKEWRKHQKDLERLRLLRPMDDDFMRCMFKDNIPLVQLVLRIITGKADLEIVTCETQKDLKRLVGARSICLDAYGADSQGTKYNLEIQRGDRGAEPQRARYHSGALDIENLDAGQDFSELVETYTIFITEHDVFNKGEPIYWIERMNLMTGEPFGDGSHIIYVNGAYRGDSDIGKLMHDFNCANADEMYFDLMAERARYLKENQEGVGTMCKLMEEMRQEEREEALAEGREEGRVEGRAEMAMDLVKAGFISEEALNEFLKSKPEEMPNLT